ncbi:MAG: hypothetical protein HC800_12620 [Phormidesmis sp. RL_2_1]|nr:hypothetical protein [Phormidesmis sp. RL_2_1]
MADLLIPAILRNWLYFLLAFVLLGYPVTFSIVFGAIGGFSSGIVTAWAQVKGGVPSAPEEEQPVVSKRRFEVGRGLGGWNLPFLGPSKSKRRYLERTRKARASRQSR